MIQRAAEVIALTVLPTGQLPPVGDGAPPGETAVASFLGLAHSACKSDVISIVLRRLGLLRHLPPGLRPVSSAKQVKLPTSVRYPATGIAVVRSSWRRDASAISLNIPNGENQGVGHAHDDALSISFIARGKPFLWLPGNELYLYVNAPQHRGREARGYPYSELSKSVVLVGGRPRQAPAELKDTWGSATLPVDSALETGPKETVLRGSCAAAGGARCSREIRHRKRTGWAVHDRVEGAGRRHHTALFHFDYGVELKETPRGIAAIRDGVRLHIGFTGERLGNVGLRRNVKWLRPNAHRKGDPFPWLLEVRFGGTGDDTLVTTLQLDTGR